MPDLGGGHCTRVCVGGGGGEVYISHKHTLFASHMIIPPAVLGGILAILDEGVGVF